MRNESKALLIALTLALAAQPLSAFAAEVYTATEMAEVRSSDEKQIRSLRDREIEELRKVLGRRLPANRMADLYVRLSELYLEAYRAEFLDEAKVHEKRLSESRADKFIDRTHSKPYLRFGIRAAEEVLRLKIPHPKLDQIYYFLGVYYDELEDETNAIKYFRQLTVLFPSSPYAGEGYRALGESLYLKQDYRAALAYYQRARENYQGSALPRLLQKMAWTNYRLRNYDRAISTMREAISEASKDNRFLNLRDEALRDMALFMTEGGQVDEAIAYFKKVSGDQAFFPSTLEKLGATYERQAQSDKATQVYEALLKLAPNSEEAFRVRAKLFELDLRRAQYGNALKRLQGLKIPEYTDENESGVVAKNLKAGVRKVATEEHDEFRKKQRRESLVIAEAYYQVYWKQFLDGRDSAKEIPEIQMYLAEVKRELGKSAEAADLYKTVIKSGDERYAKEAASFWMASLSDSAKKQPGGKPLTGSGQFEKDFLDASDYVADNFGTKSEGLEARLNAARVLAGGDGKAQSQAIDRIRDLIKAAPSSVQARTGAKLWIQIYEDRLPKKAEDFASNDQVKDLNKVIHTLRENSDLMAGDRQDGKGELAKLLNDRETRLKVGAISERERAKDYDAAAKGYEDFAAESKDPVAAEKAYQGAVDSYVKVGEYDSAVRVISAWVGRMKDSRPALEALRTTATNAMVIGRFEKAAELFSLMGHRNDPAAIDLAGRLYEGIGNLTSASAEFRYYLSQFKSAPDRGLIALSLAQWSEYTKDDAGAVKYYQLCLSENNVTSAECGARLADLFVRLNELPKANRALQVVAERGRGKKVDRSPWVGYARYRLAENLEHEKRFSALQLPDDKLKRGLEERLKFLELLNQNYQNVVEVSGPWAVAGLNRLASWVSNFADEVDQIDAPAGSTPEQTAAFRKSLKSVSDPLRAKALETWRTGYQKAVSGELLSPIVPEIADRLADAGAASPGRAQGFRDKFRLSGQTADGGAEGRGPALERVRKALLEDAKREASWIDYGNLLWGEGKPLLAKIAYERALSLSPKAAAALNNRGVLIASGAGQEDWIRVAEAYSFFGRALDKDSSFLAAKFNRGSLLNYYRLFSKAKPYWSSVGSVAPQPDVLDGIAIAEQGLGETEVAVRGFQRAEQAGAAEDRVSAQYHEAARLSRTDPKKCMKIGAALDSRPLSGFERDAVVRLKAFCESRVSAPKAGR